VLAKVGSLAKFGAVFVAFGGYALIWGWRFALGVVLLIFLHEMGHWLEAEREGLNPSWPVFIPFLGAYVRHTRGNPWQTARVAIAGPILGGIAALFCYVLGRANGSELLIALGYFGFVLNLINLLPFGILDGGSVWRSTRWLWYGGGREKALVSGLLYATTALLLAIGAFAAYLPQHRL
jgi:Zn-dependent protease